MTGSRIMGALTLVGVVSFGSIAELQGQSVLSANASFVWVNGMGASGNVPDLCTDTNGNCYAICHFNSANAIVGGTTLTNMGGFDTFLVKYNSQGQVQWLKQFTGDATDFGLGVEVDSSGSVYAVGNFYSDVLGVDSFSVTNSTGTGASDIFVAKFDTNGNSQWLRRFGGNGTDTAFHVAVDHNDNVLVCGSFYSTTIAFDGITLTNASADTDLLLAKLDSAGNVLWARRAGGTKGDSAYRMVVDEADNCYVTGYYNTSATFGTTTLTSAGGFDAYIAKYDTSGNLQWVTSGGGTGTDEGFCVAQDAAGNCYITGYSSSANASFGGHVIQSAGGNDIFTARISPSGSVLWARSGGGTGDDRGRGLAVDAQGNAYISGFFSGTATFGTTTLTNSAGEDMFILKYDPSGEVQWVIPVTGPADDVANNITLDTNGHLYISGSCSSNLVFGGLTFTNGLNGAMFVARLDFLPPRLNIALTDGRPILAWGTNFLTPLVVQVSTNLQTWQDMTNSPVLLNDAYSITNLAPARPSFYRLRNLD